MREAPDHPAAIVHRVTDTVGEARYLVLAWHVEPSRRRMTAIHTSLADADLSVRYQRPTQSSETASRMGAPNGGGTIHPGER